MKLKAHAPSLHMIRVDIETEVTPVVGTEKQSEELVRYLLEEFENDPQQIWSTNFFGKSLHDMVREGLSNKPHAHAGGCPAKSAGNAYAHYQRRQRRHDLHPAIVENRAVGQAMPHRQTLV